VSSGIIEYRSEFYNHIGCGEHKEEIQVLQHGHIVRLCVTQRCRMMDKAALKKAIRIMSSNLKYADRIGSLSLKLNFIEVCKNGDY
jgi:hypothetical protein